MTKVDSVLLIDDDHVNNHLNRKLIKNMNISYDIHVATNGSEAVKFVEDRGVECPGLIFLDLNMPAIDGFEFLEIFQKMEFPNKDQIVIVILTTSTNIGDMQKIKKYGNYEFVNKPLTEDKIKEIVAKYFSDSKIISGTR
jgi:CheY-like chemotaxis protein